MYFSRFSVRIGCGTSRRYGNTKVVPKNANFYLSKANNPLFLIAYNLVISYSLCHQSIPTAKELMQSALRLISFCLDFRCGNQMATNFKYLLIHIQKNRVVCTSILLQFKVGKSKSLIQTRKSKWTIQKN